MENTKILLCNDKGRMTIINRDFRDSIQALIPGCKVTIKGETSYSWGFSIQNIGDFKDMKSLRTLFWNLCQKHGLHVGTKIGELKKTKIWWLTFFDPEYSPTSWNPTTLEDYAKE